MGSNLTRTLRRNSALPDFSVLCEHHRISLTASERGAKQPMQYAKELLGFCLWVAGGGGERFVEKPSRNPGG